MRIPRGVRTSVRWAAIVVVALPIIWIAVILLSPPMSHRAPHQPQPGEIVLDARISPFVDLVVSPAGGLVGLWVIAFALRADARRSFGSGAGRRKDGPGPGASGADPDDSTGVVTEDQQRRARRMDRTRFWIRTEFGLAIMAVIVAAYLTVAIPGCGCPMFAQPSLVERLLPWAGVAGVVVGLAAMIRLSRIDPEAGDRSWRYRA
jgi:hypothetical protein